MFRPPPPVLEYGEGKRTDPLNAVRHCVIRRPFVRLYWWIHPLRAPASRRPEANGCNLDLKNPRAKEDIAHLPPDQLAASILQKEHCIAEIMGNIRALLAKGPTV